MDIEKNERINALFEFYQPLLTKKQNEYISFTMPMTIRLARLLKNLKFRGRRSMTTSSGPKRFWKATRTSCICMPILRCAIARQIEFSAMSRSIILMTPS